MNIGYVRVSTEDQANSGVSLDDQKARIQAMCVARGEQLDQIIEDAGASAKTLERPGMKQLLDLISRGKTDRIIVVKLDRLTRSVKDLGELLEVFEKKKVNLVSVSESLDTASAGGRLMLNLLASVSQWEREVISERTSAAMAYLRNTKKPYCRQVFGYRREGSELIEVPEELALLSHLRQARKQGKSFRELSRMMKDAGHPGYHPYTVKVMLERKMA